MRLGSGEVSRKELPEQYQRQQQQQPPQQTLIAFRGKAGLRPLSQLQRQHGAEGQRRRFQQQPERDQAGQGQDQNLGGLSDQEAGIHGGNHDVSRGAQREKVNDQDGHHHVGDAGRHAGCQPGDGSYAANCLLARRLAERGVRFIQLYHRGWDHHGGIKANFEKTANLVDQGTAALIRDLKDRGMLEDTLIIFGGEFGRTPMAQGSGRDHHINAFSMFLCGGGVNGGVTHGATDELGYAAVVDPVHVHDLHATMLHLLGIDHLRLTYRFQGRDFRLTDVFGHLIKPVLA